jgi:hypothetical protein
MLAGLLLPTPACSQTEKEASLRQALSLIGGGSLDALWQTPQAAQVTQDGDQFRVHIPVPQLPAPPDAAIDLAATQTDGGIWNITAVTLPMAGTVLMPHANAVAPEPKDGAPGPKTVPPGAKARTPASDAATSPGFAWSIGHEAGQGRLDPGLATPSSYSLELGDIAFHDTTPRPKQRLTIGLLAFDGTVTGETDGRINRRSHARMEKLEFTGTDNANSALVASLRSLDVRSDINGLDRTREAHLRQALATITAHPPAAAPADQPHPLPPLQRNLLRTMLDDSAGLLSGLNFEETFQGLHFELPKASGDIGQIRIAMAGETDNDRLAAHVDIGVDDPILPFVTPQYALFVPHHASIRFAVAGISPEALQDFLHAATAEDANPAALRIQAVALLNQTGANAGIETLSLEAGPLLLQGSARLRPMPDGTVAVNILLKGRGLDALLAQVQADPRTRPSAPVLLSAKGMGKAEGDALVWNIALDHGLLTVNGVPVGPNTIAPRPGNR